MRIIDYNDAIDAITRYTDLFSNNVPGRTKEAWVHELYQLRPRYDVVEAAIRRCAENDHGPAWARLRGSIKVEQGIRAARVGIESGDGSEAYRAFLEQYRKEGLGRQSLTDVEIEGDAKTSPEAARIHWRVLNKILNKKLRCPEEIRRGDVSAPFDDEARWYWLQFELERERCTGGRHG